MVAGPRVVVNCRFLTQPLTGVQRFAQRIARELVDARADVQLVAPPGDLRPSELDGLVLQIGSGGGHYWEQIALPRALRSLGSPLLVNLMNTAPIVYQPQISTIHDLGFLRNPDSYSWRYRQAYRVLTPLTIRSSKVVVTVSEFSRRELQLEYPKLEPTVCVVPNAVDPILMATEGTPVADLLESPFFLSVGSLSAHKNVSRALAAFNLFRRNHGPSFRYAIVGQSARAFSDHAHASGSSVKWLGRVTDSELAWLYRHCTAYVFPSLYEGFGIPPLEAQALGAPVISSARAPMTQVLGSDGAEWVDPLSVEDLARAMCEVAGSKDRQSALSSAGRRNAENYTWLSSARTLAETIDDVLAQS
ncbi:glycosyltransferase family 4 protein [Microbacterium sp. NPDC056569]|uniref:glycosyltransferase family 4 protein n=1 Tax=Microbacterium sp. NPDC056569 TaxID=3345867 RepID=UPI003670C475